MAEKAINGYLYGQSSYHGPRDTDKSEVMSGKKCALSCSHINKEYDEYVCMCQALRLGSEKLRGDD